MTSLQFRSHLAKLCWSQRGFAALLGVTHNTVHRWALDQAVIPADVAAWLDEVAAFLKTASATAQRPLRLYPGRTR